MQNFDLDAIFRQQALQARGIYTARYVFHLGFILQIYLAKLN